MSHAALEGVRHLASFGAVSLGELDRIAPLRRRRDRKYLVDPDQGAALLADLAETGGRRVLEIDGRREFRYESVYYDTEHLTLYRAAAQRRRRRAKVRIRRYLDSGRVFLEVKRPDGRGGQRKHRTELPDRPAAFDAEMRRFVDVLADEPGLAESLRPTAMTSYVRSTLLDDASGTRTTLDRDLVCFDLRPRPRATPAPAFGLEKLVVESKSHTGRTPLDLRLWERGVRPIEFSKYCTGLAALDARLPSNRWSRTLRDHFAAV